MSRRKHNKNWFIQEWSKMFGERRNDPLYRWKRKIIFRLELFGKTLVYFGGCRISEGKERPDNHVLELPIDGIVPAGGSGDSVDVYSPPEVTEMIIEDGGIKYEKETGN